MTLRASVDGLSMIGLALLDDVVPIEEVEFRLWDAVVAEHRTTDAVVGCDAWSVETDMGPLYLLDPSIVRLLAKVLEGSERVRLKARVRHISVPGDLGFVAAFKAEEILSIGALRNADRTVPR